MKEFHEILPNDKYTINFLISLAAGKNKLKL